MKTQVQLGTRALLIFNWSDWKSALFKCQSQAIWDAGKVSASSGYLLILGHLLRSKRLASGLVDAKTWWLICQPVKGDAHRLEMCGELALKVCEACTSRQDRRGE